MNELYINIPNLDEVFDIEVISNIIFFDSFSGLSRQKAFCFLVFTQD